MQTSYHRCISMRSRNPILPYNSSSLSILNHSHLTDIEKDSFIKKTQTTRKFHLRRSWSGVRQKNHKKSTFYTLAVGWSSTIQSLTERRCSIFRTFGIAIKLMQTQYFFLHQNLQNFRDCFAEVMT